MIIETGIDKGQLDALRKAVHDLDNLDNLNTIGKLNLSSWLGDRSKYLIAEIDRLSADLKSSDELNVVFYARNSELVVLNKQLLDACINSYNWVHNESPEPIFLVNQLETAIKTAQEILK